MKNGQHILPVLKEAISLTFERSINLLENVTSSNICHSCWTQRPPLFRGLRYSEVSAIQRCTLFSGVRYSAVSAIHRCPLFRGVRYKEVFILGFALIPAVPRKCARYYHLRYWELLLYTPLKFPSNCRLLLLKPFTSV